MSCELLEKTTIKGTFVSHRRGQRRLHPKQAILTIDNVYSKDSAEKYLKNAVLFTYTRPEGEVVRIQGRIMAVHGNKGAVRATFERNLNPKAMGQRVFIKLYKVEE
ncbi:rpl35a [Ecytonucleospora hepatopenaei]|uniref:Rpl35a n=1 Tax=Ecytonucleospora hepatopenaei TaxID=646526 RepID=A0A1W0E351_9MICR|nr:rpl35a [Ecytonucleospora hepatopenaei]